MPSLYETPFWVEGPWDGRLAILARPRGGDWLEDTIRYWKSLPVSLIVSALTEEENAELGLDKEADLCRKYEVEFTSYPIIDRSIPQSMRETQGVVLRMDAMLCAGRNVGVHCRLGVGRSGMLVACCLVHRGLDHQTALSRVAVARGRPVPDTDEQRQWVAKFAFVDTW